MSAMPGKAGVLALLFLLSSAVAAPAQTQTDQAPVSEQTDDLVVTGQRRLPPSLVTEIRRFVRGHARLSRIDQLANWRDPICVRVTNLPAAYSGFIINRIETVAREAGAPTNDQDGCAPNISIMFTTEPQAVLDSIRSDRPEFLGAHFINSRDALATMARPIQAWYVTATTNGRDTAIDEPMSDPLSGVSGSRLTHGLASIFVHVLILVDANQVADAPIGPISDYLAVLALTEIREESWACGGLVTIMEHFSGCSSVPESLTTADRAFLRGLYTMWEEAVGTLQRSHISGRMGHTLREGE